jgi:hypothetical protein
LGYRHNPSELEFVFFVYPVNIEQEFYLSVLSLLCTLPTWSSTIVNRLGVETFSLVLAFSAIILFSLFGCHVPIACVGRVNSFSTHSPLQISRTLCCIYPDSLVTLYTVLQVFDHPRSIWGHNCTLGKYILSMVLSPTCIDVLL